MSAQTISAGRIEQLQATVKTFLSAFDKPIGPDQTREEFTSIFSPDIEWRDHAFLVRRVGHEAILGLHKSFLHCNQPFGTKVKAIRPTAEGCVLEQIWVGRQANDIVRPDGAVAVEASGKDFVCHVCMVMDIDEDGRIQKIDEYYNKRWDEGVGAEKYVVMKGASLKADA